MKPYVHAESSVKKWGGEIADYLPLHNWFDQTKAHFPLHQHRAILHSSFGIFLCEQVFGTNITNSDGGLVSVRSLGEQHVIEDLKCIPTVSDYLMNMKHQDWMGGKGFPPSMQGAEVGTNIEKTFISFEPPKKAEDLTYDGNPRTIMNQLID